MSNVAKSLCAVRFIVKLHLFEPVSTFFSMYPRSREKESARPYSSSCTSYALLTVPRSTVVPRTGYTALPATGYTAVPATGYTALPLQGPRPRGIVDCARGVRRCVG